ncbi:hypothetical protein K7G92_000055 [Pasteurella canis]|uniref:hypothetical protein n=1 Tax=Pasteurella canis TaxID=753 RepID=UPI00132C29BC|nr:hypothetical protein [Pasteurella canis]MXN88210.1 hypothetical protein [Pasteurella canis]UEA16913.1 hypothetical protein K7G92_000055 [Pasteurella canis]
MSLSTELDYLMRSLSCVTYNGGQHTSIQIKENDKKATLKTVTLKANNGDWFCFSPDDGRKCRNLHSRSNLTLMSPLLKISADFSHHCACDAVILFRQEDKLTILYIDLKSGNPKGYSPQFKSTRQFVRYLISLCEEFSGIKMKIYRESYIVFHCGKSSIPKRTTIPDRSKIINSKPDNAYKREVKNNDTLYLKEFLE